MKLKIGKFYKTRNGKKAYLYNVKKGLLFDRYFIAIENGDVHEIYPDGKCWSFKTSPYDLVDIWVEPSGKRVRQRETILKMLNEGKSYTQIHKETGAAHSTIARARKVGGYKTGKYNKPETLNKYKELLKQHLSLNEIAKRLKISYNAVCWYTYSNPELRDIKMTYDKRYKDGEKSS